MAVHELDNKRAYDHLTDGLPVGSVNDCTLTYRSTLKWQLNLESLPLGLYLVR